MAISVQYIANGKTTHLEEIVTSVIWSGSVMDGIRKLEVSLANTVDGRKRAVSIREGGEIRFYKDNKELFRGIVFLYDIRANGEQSITAYDEFVYLTKNQESRKFTGMTASQIMKRLCSDFDIPVGTIANTGYVIPKLIMEDRSLKEIIVTALTLTKKQTGKRFFVYSQNGRMYLSERKTMARKWIIENGVNLIDASYSVSMEDLRTQVKVIGGDEKNPIISTLKNNTLTKLYGTMQHIEESSEAKTKSQVEQLAKQLLKDLGNLSDEASIEAIGIDDVVAGSAVYVIEAMTGLKGGYYVSTDSHRFEGGNHTMSLTLTATDELPELEYQPPA
ncbi:XkdQ/YqbQ family protein [Cytobacillus oceanisediminis]|uniref:YqbQ/XkdQ domain-containing protein n=1 Tax=Cytobacillus oceanisediminis 2691 TaxID=1196031 RepID=A0A160MAU4_9BACI|nr:hypothetical protein [Cytobacillus oceanisediminis]AND39623.1 hypothetical protein A361_10900 [Cytobacillus oceanisediminis 2691]